MSKRRAQCGPKRKSPDADISEKSGSTDTTNDSSDSAVVHAIRTPLRKRRRRNAPESSSMSTMVLSTTPAAAAPESHSPATSSTPNVCSTTSSSAAASLSGRKHKGAAQPVRRSLRLNPHLAATISAESDVAENGGSPHPPNHTTTTATTTTAAAAVSSTSSSSLSVSSDNEDDVVDLDIPVRTSVVCRRRKRNSHTLTVTESDDKKDEPTRASDATGDESESSVEAKEETTDVVMTDTADNEAKSDSTEALVSDSELKGKSSTKGKNKSKAKSKSKSKAKQSKSKSKATKYNSKAKAKSKSDNNSQVDDDCDSDSDDDDNAENGNESECESSQSDIKSVSQRSRTSGSNNRNSNDSVLRSFETELQCQICSCLFVAPVTLVCGHSFCFVCILTWINSCHSSVDGAGNKHFKKPRCPNCRHAIDDSVRYLQRQLKQPQINVVLQAMVDRIVESNSSSEIQDDYKTRRSDYQKYRVDEELRIEQSAQQISRRARGYSNAMMRRNAAALNNSFPTLRRHTQSRSNSNNLMSARQNSNNNVNGGSANSNNSGGFNSSSANSTNSSTATARSSGFGPHLHSHSGSASAIAGGVINNDGLFVSSSRLNGLSMPIQNVFSTAMRSANTHSNRAIHRHSQALAHPNDGNAGATTIVSNAVLNTGAAAAGVPTHMNAYTAHNQTHTPSMRVLVHTSQPPATQISQSNRLFSTQTHPSAQNAPLLILGQVASQLHNQIHSQAVTQANSAAAATTEMAVETILSTDYHSTLRHAPPVMAALGIAVPLANRSPMGAALPPFPPPPQSLAPPALLLHRTHHNNPSFFSAAAVGTDPMMTSQPGTPASITDTRILAPLSAATAVPLNQERTYYTQSVTTTAPPTVTPLAYAAVPQLTPAGAPPLPSGSSTTIVRSSSSTTNPVVSTTSLSQHHARHHHLHSLAAQHPPPLPPIPVASTAAPLPMEVPNNFFNLWM